MGVNTHELRTVGRQFEGIPGTGPLVAPQLTPGPLSGGLVNAHNVKSAAAEAFETSVRGGLQAAGLGLVSLADAMVAEDDVSAERIARVVPGSAPRVDGGQ